ncbi:MAG: hypothetical protein ACK4GN_15940, partial [Runella sp.]
QASERRKVCREILPQNPPKPRRGARFVEKYYPKIPQASERRKVCREILPQNPPKPRRGARFVEKYYPKIPPSLGEAQG